MNIYRIILLIFLILFLFEDYIKTNKVLYKILKIITILILILLISFKGNIGRDTQMYIKYFENLSFSIEYWKSTRFEFLFFLINLVIRFFTENVIWLFTFVAIISFINIYIFINYFSISFFYSITFYYCRWFFIKDFSGIRNALASSIFYIALIKLYQSKKKEYYILVIISGLVHKSMFFYLLLPVVCSFVTKRNKIFYLLIILIPVFYILGNLKEKLNYIFLKLGIPSAYITGVYSEKDSNIIYIYSILLLVLLLFFNKKLKNKFQQKYIFLKEIYYFSMLVGASLYGYGDLAGRLVAFSNPEFVLQDKLLYLFKNRLLVRFLLIFLLIFLYYINFVVKDGLEAEYLPYFSR